MSNAAQGPVIELKPKPRRLTPRFMQLTQELRDWREADHADAITLCRSDIVEIVEGITTLTAWASDNDRA